MTTHNPKCDGSSCKSSYGEVRIVPAANHYNAFFCSTCFGVEIARREAINANPAYIPCEIPVWDTLKVRV